MAPNESQDLRLTDLASLAGFSISSDRLYLIVSQFQWIMREAKSIDAVELEGLEPLSTIIHRMTVTQKREQRETL